MSVDAEYVRGAIRPWRRYYAYDPDVRSLIPANTGTAAANTGSASGSSSGSSSSASGSAGASTSTSTGTAAGSTSSGGNYVPSDQELTDTLYTIARGLAPAQPAPAASSFDVSSIPTWAWLLGGGTALYFMFGKGRF